MHTLKDPNGLALSRSFQDRIRTQGLNATESKMYADLLTFLDEMFTKANVTYFLYAGTLLGAYR